MGNVRENSKCLRADRHSQARALGHEGPSVECMGIGAASSFAFILFVLAILVVPGQAHSDANIAAKYFPDAKIVGAGRLKYMGFNVYDAELYAASGMWNVNAPFVLTLRYLRSLSGDAIAKRSVEEMRKQGFRNESQLSGWYREMVSIFPDVNKQTALTGVRDENGYTIFYRNRVRIGTVRDREFTRRFFNIWLGASTSAPSLRKQLIGVAS